MTAVFNGELYNFRELRARARGGPRGPRHAATRRSSRTSTRSTASASSSGSTGCSRSRSGTRGRERLVLARDRVGKKPLLWTRLPDGTLAFASELKALLAPPRRLARARPRPRSTRTSRSSTCRAERPSAASRSCRPGTLLVAEGGAVARRALLAARAARAATTRRLARARPRRGRRGRAQAARRRRAARRAPLRRDRLERRRRGDGAGVGRAGAHVHGRLRGRRATTSARYARAVAERYGDRARGDRARAGRRRRSLPRLAAAFDEPFGDEAALPHVLVCEVARRHVTVALDGRRRRRGVRRLRALRRARARGPGRAARGRRSRRGRCARRRRAARAALDARPRAAASSRSPRCPRRQRYGRLMEVFPRELRAELWEPTFVARADARLGAPRPGRRGHRGAAALDVGTYLPGDLLLKADIASMAHSLELRSPLLDHRVLELGARRCRTAEASRARRGKVALRRAFADELPPEVAGRGKTGFGVPSRAGSATSCASSPPTLLLDERARARGQLRPGAVERLLDEHADGRADHGHRLWCLLMLELWQRDARRRRAAGARGRAREAAPRCADRRASSRRCRASSCSLARARRHPRRVHREERRLRADRSSHTGTFGFIPGEPSA